MITSALITFCAGTLLALCGGGVFLVAALSFAVSATILPWALLGGWGFWLSLSCAAGLVTAFQFGFFAGIVGLARLHARPGVPRAERGGRPPLA